MAMASKKDPKAEQRRHKKELEKEWSKQYENMCKRAQTLEIGQRNK